MLSSIFTVSLAQSAIELGCIYALVALALFVSFSILNIADLSTDGCFTLGCAVCAMVTLQGHPFLGLLAATGAGVISGFVTAFLQTRLGVESILAGIIVNTGLYTINIAVMGFSSTINLFANDTIFTLAKDKIGGNWYEIIAILIVILIVAVLLLFHIDYETYANGAQYISIFLTPATVSLAVPLYRQLELLKTYPKAIFGGIFAGVLTAMVSVFALSLMFGLNHEQYVTLLPKSITTAIGMGISEKMGGIVTITVVVIIVTGILGNILADTICRLCKIEDPIAKGLAIGTSAHALGTAKAMELGEIEGAMSSLSIVVCGILTVISVSIFANFI